MFKHLEVFQHKGCKWNSYPIVADWLSLSWSTRSVGGFDSRRPCWTEMRRSKVRTPLWRETGWVEGCKGAAAGGCLAAGPGSAGYSGTTWCWSKPRVGWTWRVWEEGWREARDAADASVWAFHRRLCPNHSLRPGHKRIDVKGALCIM